MNFKEARVIVATIVLFMITSTMVPISSGADTGIDKVFFIATGLPSGTTAMVSYSGTAPDGQPITGSVEFTIRSSGSGASSTSNAIELQGSSLLTITFPTIPSYSYILTIGGPSLPATVIPYPYTYTLPPSLSRTHPTLYWIRADYTAFTAEVWTKDSANTIKDTFQVGEEIYLHWTCDPSDSPIDISVVDGEGTTAAGPYPHQLANNSPITFTLDQQGTYTIMVNGEPKGYITINTLAVVPEPSMLATVLAITAAEAVFTGLRVSRKRSYTLNFRVFRV